MCVCGGGGVWEGGGEKSILIWTVKVAHSINNQNYFRELAWNVISLDNQAPEYNATIYS